MDKKRTEEIEIELLLEGIFLQYGHDFRQYARKSITRQIHNFLKQSDCTTITELSSRCLHSSEYFKRFRHDILVHTTSFFRDNAFYQQLVVKVVPYLKTHAYPNIWYAGCSTGEELWSLMILLKQIGLLQQCRVFATDYSDKALAKAKKGIYQLDSVQEAAQRYQQAYLSGALSDHFHTDNNNAIVVPALRGSVTFANHNLATDTVFMQADLIICRNVLIYFDKDLQHRCIRLFDQSLTNNGFLCLGTSESLPDIDLTMSYKTVCRSQRIFHKKVL